MPSLHQPATVIARHAEVRIRNALADTRIVALVGIEVKAAVSVGPADLRGLKRLREAAGRSFACGVILHDGDRIQRVGDDLYAMPVSQLWA